METMTIADFIAKHVITVTLVYQGQHTEAPETFGPARKGWVHHKWSFTLKCDKRTMTGDMRMGVGHESKIYKPGYKPLSRRYMGEKQRYAIPPTLACIMDSLASDARDVDQPFECWAQDFGYDVDSIRALRTYEACQKIRFDLITLLGRAGFEELCSCEGE